VCVRHTRPLGLRCSAAAYLAGLAVPMAEVGQKRRFPEAREAFYFVPVRFNELLRFN
jgi:hypothetical protein